MVDSRSNSLNLLVTVVILIIGEVVVVSIFA